jgi:ABC-type glycerol-3-phosphate transport system substrate-binding protein
MIRKLMALSLTALALAACGGDEDSSTGPAPAPQKGTITMLNDRDRVGEHQPLHRRHLG